jgi:hypothetical protein
VFESGGNCLSGRVLSYRLAAGVVVSLRRNLPAHQSRDGAGHPQCLGALSEAGGEPSAQPKVNNILL